MSLKKTIIATVAALTLVGAAHAGLVASNIYVEEMADAGGVFPTGGLSARTRFLAALDDTVQSYGFTNDPVGTTTTPTAPLAVNFAGSAATTIKATLRGSGFVENSTSFGRFNTTPLPAGSTRTRWWAAPAVAGTSGFSIEFDTAISAFGFYGTDIGDFGGTLKLILTPSAVGALDETVVVTSTLAADGALLFYGFASRDVAYKKITFVTTGSSVTDDYFGFDDFVVADRDQIRVANPTLPEPGSLALVGLALLGAAATRRRA